MSRFDGRRFCKVCGRRWWAVWYGPNAGYWRMCDGCGRRTDRCTCEPLEEAAA